MNALIMLAMTILVAAPASQSDYAFFAQDTIASHGDGWNHGLPCMARLSDESILVVWARYKPDSSDFAVVGVSSRDGLCRWTEHKVLIDHPGLLDADPSIVVLDRAVLVTCTTVDFSEGIRTSKTWCVRSEDYGRHWGELYEIPMNHRYTCGKCHRAVRLPSGTLLLGYSWDVPCEQGRTLQEEGQMDLRAGVMRSTDNGLTWTNGGDTTATYERLNGGAVSGTDEPALVVLDDGSVYMLMRTGAKALYEAHSTDEGLTWHDIQPSPLRGTNAPAALGRFEAGGHKGIWCVWDNAADRFPLCAAASFDGCKTWTAPRDIGFPYTGQASYPSCEQAPDGTLLAVWQQDVPGGRDLRCARFSAAWLLGGNVAVATAAKPATIVLFGESTTAPRGTLINFAKLLEQDLPARGVVPTIINAGKGGENTDQARERFEQDVLARKPDIVTIYYGLNDAAIDVWKDATAPRVTADKFEENLRHFTKRLKEAGTKVILMTPNPCCWSPQEKELYGKPPYDINDVEGINKVLQEHIAAVRKVAVGENVALVDVYQILSDYAHTHSYNELLLDGVHPNEYAHRLIADALLEQIPALTQ